MVSLYVTGVGRVGHGRDAVLLRVRDGECGRHNHSGCWPTAVRLLFDHCLAGFSVLSMCLSFFGLLTDCRLAAVRLLC